MSAALSASMEYPRMRRQPAGLATVSTASTPDVSPSRSSKRPSPRKASSPRLQGSPRSKLGEAVSDTVRTMQAQIAAITLRVEFLEEALHGGFGGAANTSRQTGHIDLAAADGSASGSIGNTATPTEFLTSGSVQTQSAPPAVLLRPTTGLTTTSVQSPRAPAAAPGLVLYNTTARSAVAPSTLPTSLTSLPLMPTHGQEAMCRCASPVVTANHSMQTLSLTSECTQPPISHGTGTPQTPRSCSGSQLQQHHHLWGIAPVTSPSRARAGVVSPVTSISPSRARAGIVSPPPGVAPVAVPVTHAVVGNSSSLGAKIGWQQHAAALSGPPSAAHSWGTVASHGTTAVVTPAAVQPLQCVIPHVVGVATRARSVDRPNVRRLAQPPTTGLSEQSTRRSPSPVEPKASGKQACPAPDSCTLRSQSVPSTEYSNVVPPDTAEPHSIDTACGGSADLRKGKSKECECSPCRLKGGAGKKCKDSAEIHTPHLKLSLVSDNKNPYPFWKKGDDVEPRETSRARRRSSPSRKK